MKAVLPTDKGPYAVEGSLALSAGKKVGANIPVLETLTAKSTTKAQISLRIKGMPIPGPTAYK
jgi:hypothetical protein